MADLPSYSDTVDDSGKRPDRESTAGTPGWVKVFGTIVIVLVLLLVILYFIGAGDHGPGRHSSPDDSGGYTVPNEYVAYQA